MIMKKIFVYVALITSFGVYSCKKVENKVFFEGGTSPQLSANRTAVTLESNIEGQTAIVFNWTNPNYQFTTGLSSHAVSYTLELDTVGSNFNNPNKIEIGAGSDLSTSLTVLDLNSRLGNVLKLPSDPRRVFNIEARIISSLNGNFKLTSNVIRFSASPYSPPPLVLTPDNNNIWLVGGASQGGWNNPLVAPYLTSQKFVRRSSTLYDLTVPLAANEGFLILPVMGSWSFKYCINDGVDRTLTTTGGDFVYKTSGGQDFLSPSPGGNFKITLNFQNGKFTVERQ
jgi:starch-binding outer membrane protein SusE/F